MFSYNDAINLASKKSEEFFIKTICEKEIDIDSIDFNSIIHDIKTLNNGCTIVNHYINKSFLFSEAVSIVMNSKSGNIYVFQYFYKDELMWHKLTLP